MLQSSLIPTFGTQLNSMIAFATAPSANALVQTWRGVADGVLTPLGFEPAVLRGFSPAVSSSSEFVRFRDKVIDGVRPALDREAMRFATMLRCKDNKLLCRAYGFRDLQGFADAVVRTQELNIISERPVEALERSAGLMCCGTEFYRAKKALAHEVRAAIVASAPVEREVDLTPLAIRDDFLQDVKRMRLKRGFLLSTSAAAALGGMMVIGTGYALLFAGGIGLFHALMWKSGMLEL